MRYIVDETMHSIRAGILLDIIFEEGDPSDTLVIPAKVDGVKIVTVYNFPTKTQTEMRERLKNYDLVIEEGIEKIFHPFSNSSVKSVSIPSSLINIPSHFCFSCRDLQSVTIAEPSSLRSIEPYAFKDCINLSKFHFPDSLVEIETEAFMGSGITSAVFPEKSQLRTIGDEVFANCWCMGFADLGNTRLTSIPNETFKGDVSLKKVIFPERLKEIGIRAFLEADLSETSLADCKNLTSIQEEAFKNTYINDGVMPENLQYICDEAFLSTEIKVLTVNPALKEIGCEAFCNTQIEQIKNIGYLKNTKVKSLAFTHCMFKEITVPNCCYDGTEVFSDNHELTFVKFEDDMEEIPIGMFKDCRNMQRAEFPPKLRYIRKSAFLNTDIDDLDFSKCDCLIVDEEAFNDKTSGYTIKISPYITIKDKTLLMYTESLF